MDIFKELCVLCFGVPTLIIVGKLVIDLIKIFTKDFVEQYNTCNNTWDKLWLIVQGILFILFIVMFIIGALVIGQEV